MSGDGTFVGEQLHVVNFMFTHSRRGQKRSSDGNYYLAIFRQKESYDEMKTALSDVRHIENLSSIQVNDPTFDIVYFLGGDWKLLALVTDKLMRERGH